MASGSASLRSVESPASLGHMHDPADVCPFCEQSIPNAKLEEIRQRVEAKDRERTGEITALLEARYAATQAEHDERAQAALEQARRDAAQALELERQSAATLITAAQEKAVREAAATAQVKIDAAEEEKRAVLLSLEEATGAKAASEAVVQELKGLLETTRQEHTATVEDLRSQAQANEAAVREDARKTLEEEHREKFSSLQRSHAEAEEALKTKATEAEAARLVAEEEARNSKAALETQVNERVQEVREVMEKDKAQVLATEKSLALKEKEKLLDKVGELQRALEKKSAEELGEGAELDLFEVLKATFDGDKIERVAKGVAGADIIHTVLHNGKECGRIVYDSKNRNSWRNDYVTKLAADQLAARAEHAILATNKFPAGARHVHIQEKVVLVSPARVAVMAELLRSQLVQTHALRLSNKEKANKTTALYSFITSDRFAELFGRIEKNVDDLLELQVEEKKAHDKHWAKQGQLLTKTQKLRADIGLEIDTIIGTAGSAEQ